MCSLFIGWLFRREKSPNFFGCNKYLNARHIHDPRNTTSQSIFLLEAISKPRFLDFRHNNFNQLQRQKPVLRWLLIISEIRLCLRGRSWLSYWDFQLSYMTIFSKDRRYLGTGDGSLGYPMGKSATTRISGGMPRIFLTSSS